MDKKSVKKLNGKKLSTLVQNYRYNIEDFLDEDLDEMTWAHYDMLKNHKVEIEILENDFNYDYIIRVENFEAWCIFA